MSTIAQGIWGIPVVASTTERATLFPSPPLNQRVHNLLTRRIERHNGVQWVTDQFDPVFDVTGYGATGDGSTDDSAAVVLAVAAASSAAGTTGGAKIRFPYSANGYVIKNITIPAGVSVEADLGTECKLPASQPDFTRMFVTADSSSATDLAPSAFRNLTLNGNRANQGTYTGFEKEHNALIAAGTTGTGAGRLRIVIDNVTVKESTGDGVSIGPNVRAFISDLWADNCFRGGLTVYGGYSQVTVVNYMGFGSVHPSHLHIESDVTGYGSTYKLACHVTNAWMQGSLSVAAGDDSTIILDSVYSGPGCTFSGANSTFVISNSRLEMGASDGVSNRLVNPHSMTFNNCEIFVTRELEAAGAKTLMGINVYWDVGDATGSKRVTLNNCRFYCKSNILGGDTTYAVYSQNTTLALDNRIVMNHCEIAKEFTYGTAQTGGQLIHRNLINYAATPFYIGPGSDGLKTTIDGLELGGNATKFAHIVTHDPTCIHWWKNVELDESLNVITTDSGVSGSTYRGRRIIYVAAAPAGATPGLVGDVCRLKVPVSGSVFEWVATTSSTTGATWKASTTLA